MVSLIFSFHILLEERTKRIEYKKIQCSFFDIKTIMYLQILKRHVINKTEQNNAY